MSLRGSSDRLWLLLLVRALARMKSPTRSVSAAWVKSIEQSIRRRPDFLADRMGLVETL